jgi:polyhydroxybutyrate depolymerase
MKKMYSLLTVCCFFFETNAQTTLSKTININGVSRAYRIYIPASYIVSSAPVPLLFNFHGYTSNNVQQELYGDFRPIADTANFILVHPQGLVIGGSTGFNNFGVIGSLPDDVGFIDQLIDTLKANYNINLNKVYSTGLSNGGFMSYDLACLLSNRFAAIASVSGSMVSTHLAACNPSHPTPIMQIHGDADPTVSYTGVGGIIACTHIDTLIKWWVTKNNCTGTPNMTNVPNTSTTDGCNAEHYVYNNGTKGSTVELYKIIGGGHTWPGAGITIGVTCQDFKASKEIWRFFNQFSLDQLGNPASVKNVNDMNVSLAPNPTNGILKLNCFENELYNLDIFSSMGLKIYSQKNMHNSNIVDLKNISNGMYFYKISDNKNHLIVGKIIKE